MRQEIEYMQERILVAIPMYNCELQIGRVLQQFDDQVRNILSDILVIDNRSKDKSISSCQDAIKKMNGFKVTLIQNRENYNLGGSHKVAFNYALDHGYDYVVILHGDDQGSIQDLVPLITEGAHQNLDCFLGARFMKGARLINYSQLRTMGNIFFNRIVSLICQQKIFDLGAGLNIYKTRFLQKRFYIHFPDALTFNYYMLFYTVDKSAKFKFFPLSWREEDQVSNVKLFRQTYELMKIVFYYCLNRQMLLHQSYKENRSYLFDRI